MDTDVSTLVQDVTTSRLSPDEAGTRLVNLLAGPDSHAGAAWNAVFTEARRGDAATQQSLIDFLAAVLKRLPADEDGQQPRRLPDFGLQMRELWNKAPPTMSADEWAHVNGFAARCTAAEIDDFSLFAVWTFRDALETDLPFTAGNKTNQVAIDTFPPAVGAWLEQAGLLLAQYAVESRQFATASNDPAKTGQLLRDAGVTQGGYSPQRWRFWRQRLQALAEGSSDGKSPEAVHQEAVRALEGVRSAEQGTSLGP
jgi:hypothetical protein